MNTVKSALHPGNQENQQWSQILTLINLNNIGNKNTQNNIEKKNKKICYDKYSNKNGSKDYLAISLFRFCFFSITIIYDKFNFMLYFELSTYILLT
jgi:hypothetical protein